MYPKVRCVGSNNGVLHFTHSRLMLLDSMQMEAFHPVGRDDRRGWVISSLHVFVGIDYEGCAWGGSERSSGEWRAKCATCHFNALCQ